MECSHKLDVYLEYHLVQHNILKPNHVTSIASLLEMITLKEGINNWKKVIGEGLLMHLLEEVHILLCNL